MSRNIDIYVFQTSNLVLVLHGSSIDRRSTIALKILSGIGGAVAYGTNVEGSEFLHHFIATSVKRFARR